MGVLAALTALIWSPPPMLRALLTVGLLGAFTTFSTFSLDAAVLIERGAWAMAAAYVAASVLLCLGGLFAGLALVRMVAS